MEYLMEGGCGQSGGRNESWVLSVNSIYGTTLWTPHFYGGQLPKDTYGPPAPCCLPCTLDFLLKIISANTTVVSLLWIKNSISKNTLDSSRSRSCVV